MWPEWARITHRGRLAYATRSVSAPGRAGPALKVSICLGAPPAPSSDTAGDGSAPSATGTAGIPRHDGRRSGAALVPVPGSSGAWTGVLHDAEALIGSARYG
ncbi:hypothetical protein TU94_26980 [Streptomyces cyaneogriseus subsp. noncyanogenus]|uniref:Uncharacterized protein n=1 Tax=Streptomyces cyaneogriseus subsp. noncyanogenus TaxID=477245 RepID=A0A0C5G3N0_9ACTN|nr:hypothetical protein TU94_26980 [Streptomyces cyaneogriseus subsp. noncyanogenus]